MRFCRTIYLWPQNTPQFRQSLLHWSQISFPEAFFLGLQTASSRWEPDWLGERRLFSFSLGVVFSQFLPSNAPITLYNIHYWWFFLSQVNQWIKYRAHPKIQRPKSYQLTLAFLVALHGSHPLLSTELTADLTLECTRRKMECQNLGMSVSYCR